MKTSTDFSEPKQMKKFSLSSKIQIINITNQSLHGSQLLLLVIINIPWHYNDSMLSRNPLQPFPQSENPFPSSKFSSISHKQSIQALPQAKRGRSSFDK
jgi:hypothetical protein